MGEVFRAHDPQLDREVALKILRREPDDTASAALLREARVAASLDHPHVVAVFEVGEAPGAEPDGGMAYMTMELVDGRSLKTFVGDPDRSVASLVGWLVEIAQALGFAHRRGLVHGDVKPSNVMVRDDGHTKLLDFGIARRVARRDPEAVTRTDTRTASSSAASAVPENAGTPAYMAPEQLLGQPIDGRTDQFAWGVMAYELLCGARPWLSEREPVQLAAEILSRMPPPPAEVSARVPDAVSRVVMRALAKSPEARFATMDDLVADLVMPAPSPAIIGRPAEREGGVE
jgi:serine/threonine protein kinase